MAWEVERASSEQRPTNAVNWLLRNNFGLLSMAWCWPPLSEPCRWSALFTANGRPPDDRKGRRMSAAQGPQLGKGKSKGKTSKKTKPVEGASASAPAPASPGPWTLSPPVTPGGNAEIDRGADDSIQTLTRMSLARLFLDEQWQDWSRWWWSRCRIRFFFKHFLLFIWRVETWTYGNECRSEAQGARANRHVCPGSWSLMWIRARPRKAATWLSKRAQEKGKEHHWQPLSLDRKRGFDMAQAKEFSNVLQSKALRPLTSDERMKSNPRRCMQMRRVLTTKPNGDAKARLVILGCQAPHLCEVQAAGPTITIRRMSRCVMLATRANLGLTMWRLPSCRQVGTWRMRIRWFGRLQN